MNVNLDQNSCTGCGLCPEICPEVFDLNEDGVAQAKVTKVPPENEQAVREAADSCPVTAISID